ncbi:unnamed protein product [Phytophthora fragariaefolia]|uniref:Unnamed protein product n=1 Tax=Phytophthora fragariaefolia TaxID=1490495 RepID=A0A9W7D9J2_9STRA|nr:unnamed protein product [Phytophthora fragariaefolia]
MDMGRGKVGEYWAILTSKLRGVHKLRRHGYTCVLAEDELGAAAATAAARDGAGVRSAATDAPAAAGHDASDAAAAAQVPAADAAAAAAPGRARRVPRRSRRRERRTRTWRTRQRRTRTRGIPTAAEVQAAPQLQPAPVQAQARAQRRHPRRLEVLHAVVPGGPVEAAGGGQWVRQCRASGCQ